MTPSNGKVSITFALLERIFTARYSITTTRLLIAMIHLQDMHDLWSTHDEFMRFPERAQTWASGAELRALVGPKAANKAAALTRLVSEVSDHAQTGGLDLFDKIAMIHKNRTLTWQFPPFVHELMALRWQKNFAILDLGHVAQCRSNRTLILYCSVQNLRKSWIPEFCGPVEGLWSDYRPGLFDSLRQVAAMVDTTFFVGLEPIRGSRSTESVRYRLRHPGTTWYPDKIRHWAHGARVFKISASDAREIEPRNLCEYAIGNEEPAQVEAILRRNLCGVDPRRRK